MRRILTLVLVAAASHAPAQYWTELAPYPVAVSGAYGFNINGRLFVGGGISSYDPLVGHAGFYEYLPDSDQWVARATPPFGALYRAATDQWGGHVVGGSQVDTAFHPTNEHWQYDVVNDSWIQKASLPGPGREGLAIVPVFPIEYGYFYAGSGGEPSLGDWYEYSRALDSWMPIDDFNGPHRIGALTFHLSPCNWLWRIGFVGGGLPSLSDTTTVVLSDGKFLNGVGWDSPNWFHSVLEARSRAFAACFSYVDPWGQGALQVVFGGLAFENGAPTVLSDGVAMNSIGFTPPVQLGLLPFGPLAEAVTLNLPYFPGYENLYLGTGTTSLIPGTWKPATFSNTWWRYTAGGLDLGVEENGAQDLSVRPNGEGITVSWSPGTDAVRLDVLDVMGRTVRPTITVSGASGQVDIPLTGLPTGAYLVCMQTPQGRSAIRFIQP